jgi:hypothetical protein
MASRANLKVAVVHGSVLQQQEPTQPVIDGRHERTGELALSDRGLATIRVGAEETFKRERRSEREVLEDLDRPQDSSSIVNRRLLQFDYLPPEELTDEPEDIFTSLVKRGIPEVASTKLAALAELAVSAPSLFAVKMAAAEKAHLPRQRGPAPILTPEQQEEARARRRNGETYMSIAKSFNVSEPTILRLIRAREPRQR